ncbi:MAG TPA: bifunctional (p)ppGpp synthetase/guanosine-3',5'-bis(diphosphate) 3'-pyrophosphohydrolase [Amaricoccus sp.]|uniref:RelA/SpoT family protein n=1 Tax=Amaricoccus sp. TaxID=1872485 RepID=UPI002C472E07|nr:bifunctional (p)ppGpp synthetase/guanosine-3',5'-bis(diphosphate) 3'-pyrophosphohydrolase [Amaricoccus sp.]HMQ93082.1 bifunctional (p)ppGpp synthetase/guanosine-3',5'-bis(diphosphate) 3'-pyrophosphohydrolase [Amaricoccus sp.]HMR54235.1 bifunctional (p)ppGpp synthetase/guanosine-3',5'-bis(diphosphate) 3'-pyrophosphohydrolase [Amaricoccus sp.]HMR60071.1 bifunctional (p)ppGpp synthetase/guanosine-3',5'-bis(diphosphate) 3'-pyrophosphohydrolase [Amaricoccus sp.]HMU01221.1 bifunctional (p)ppGpp sy
MIPVEALTSLMRSYNPRCAVGVIEAAYDYGRRMHEGQFRTSGELYFSHPVAVAMLLAEQRLDDNTIITALLHDTIEDTGSTYNEIALRFGDEVAQLVDGVTKLTNLELSQVGNAQAENFRKLLMAMSKDLRVLLVKLADRLHNMRTIRHLPPEKQVRKARETMDIFAPLAGRMGMQWMRDELEDISFRILNPEARNSIIRRFLTLRNESGDVIPKITEDIRTVLAGARVTAEVLGREKKPYSIWRKMEEKKEGFSRLSDIYGFRIVTRSVEECYMALGAVHQRWRAVPGRFKDYISQPKSNGYRSIHTTVSGRDGKRVEVQIRTLEMHAVAESGVAAHWSYRDGERFENPFAVDPFRWLRSLTERFEGAEDSEDFLEHVKLEMFQDQVFCFTPKGEVVKLPRGATPIDFAYAIHTRIGDSCVGAKVDGNRVPLWTKLRNGQSVTIIRAEGQRPQPSWEDMVITGRAKSAIRRSLRGEQRATQVRLGREIARVALERVGKRASDKALEAAAKRLGLEEGDDVLARLGAAEMTGKDLVATLYPELQREPLPAAGDGTAPVVIGLGSGQEARPAPCCNPIPGERIVGIAVRGKGVMIHAIDCEELVAFEEEPDRWIDLRWAEGHSRPDHAVAIEIALANDAGVLGRICTLIGEQHANITDIDFTDRKPDFYRMIVEIEVRDMEHLTHVLTAIDADSDVAQVRRFRRTAAAARGGAAHRGD